MADAVAPQSNGTVGQQISHSAIFEKANRPVTLKVYFFSLYYSDQCLINLFGGIMVMASMRCLTGNYLNKKSVFSLCLSLDS